MNIIFDVGMVLADFRWREYCRELGISDEHTKLLAERMIEDPIWNEFDLAIIPPQILIDKLEKRFPECKADFRLFWKDITRLVLPFDYSAGWIERLKAQGHKMFLLSNYPGFMFDIHSKNFGFMDKIDGKVVSYEYHIMKPAHEIYQLLMKKYGLEPSECIFIDDRPINIAGAEECGIKGIVFTGYEDASAKLDALING